MSSETPPSINFFKTLPKPSATRKQWGVYAATFEHKQNRKAEPRVYTGSGTDKLGGVQYRVRDYENGTASLALLDRKAQEPGYILKYIGLLCWVDKPTLELVPRLRARMLVLEALLMILFCTCVKTIMDTIYIPDFFLWDRDDIVWGPLCNHLSLNERVRADLKLTAEELKVAEEARRKRALQSQLACQQRAKARDLPAFLARGRASYHRRQKRKNALKPPKRKPKPVSAEKRQAQKKSVDKAIAERRHHCISCDYVASAKSKLLVHKTTKKCQRQTAAFEATAASA
jgi:hypothetical protein